MSSKESKSNDEGGDGTDVPGEGADSARDKRRTRELEEELDRHQKRAKTATSSINAVAQEYTCPITHELMVDPVTARDAHLYEREAIEETIRVQGDELKSPKTGVEMEPELLPAVSVKNTIEALVESGAVDGELADHYKQSKLVFKMKNKANDGDIELMHSLGEWYRDGTNGLPENIEVSKEWFERAADATLVRDTTAKAEAGDVDAMYLLVRWNLLEEHGCVRSEEAAVPWLEKGFALKHVPSMASYASFVLNGDGGIKSDVERGIALTREAAMAGSDLACYNLGVILGYGRYKVLNKFSTDYEEARRWLTKVTDGSCVLQACKKRRLYGTS